jgi:RNase H.
LKALEAAKITSPLVQQCQKALDNIHTKHSVGLFWVPGHSMVCGNEIANKLARDGTASLLGLNRPWGYLGRISEKKIKCWMDNQHLALWWGFISTQRQA